MKLNIKLYALSSLIALSLGSCSESFLDKTPLGALSTATFDTDTTTLGLAVNRLYGTLAWREYTIGRQQFSTHEMAGDDFVPGSDANMNLFQNYTFLADNAYIQQYLRQVI